jgi:mono/diheme cytochrome c family protein
MTGEDGSAPDVRRAPAMSIAFAALLAATIQAQGPRPQTPPPLVPESLVGSVSFDLYCASCHGRQGRGDGPTAASLRTRPPDLTVLARDNRGTFPRARILDFVEGSARSASHGSTEMPVWGPTLRGLDASDARVTVRLQNLVAFIESIQQPAPAPAAAAQPAPPADGAAIFRAYCAACHGTAGRGDGVMAGQLRRPPPNLTTFATRNGGVFPAERVRQIVEGAGPAAHGDRDMPVWGPIFRRLPVGGTGAQDRIDAVVRYLQGIQERPAE